MIKITVSILFTIYSLCSCGDRRLLQIPLIAEAAATPSTGGGNAVEAVVIEPSTPSEPAANTGGNAVEPAIEPSPATPAEPAIEAATPIEPASNTGGGNAAEAATPAEPAAEPATNTGGNAVEPVPAEPATPTTNTNTNRLPWDQQISASGQRPSIIKTECRVTPNSASPNPNSCAMKPMTIYNPTDNWELQSNAVGAMWRSQVTIDIPPLSQLSELTGFWFTEPYSGADIEITINNPTGRRIGIATCSCTEAFACQNMVIYTGPDVFIQAGNFWCDPQKEGSCDNCWVKENAADVGLPCSSYA